MAREASADMWQLIRGRRCPKVSSKNSPSGSDKLPRILESLFPEDKWNGRYKIQIAAAEKDTCLSAGLDETVLAGTFTRHRLKGSRTRQLTMRHGSKTGAHHTKPHPNSHPYLLSCFLLPPHTTYIFLYPKLDFVVMFTNNSS